LPLTLKLLLLLSCVLWHPTARAQPSTAADTALVSALPIDSIFFHGNRVTKDKALLRLLSFTCGDTLACLPADILHRNRELLYNTDLFNEVRLQLDTTATGLHLHIHVTERWYLWPYLFVKLEDVTLADWLAQPDLFRVTYAVGFFKDNLTGRMDKLRFLFGNGYKKGFTVSYNRPFLLPRAQVDAFFYVNYFRNDEVNYGSLEGEVQRLRVARAGLREFYTAEMTLSKRLNPWHWLLLRTGWRQMQVADTLRQVSPGYLPLAGQVQYPLLALGYVHDTRDVRAFPQKGRKVALEAQLAGLPSVGSAAPEPFLKLAASYRQFTHLAPRWRFNYGADAQQLAGPAIPFYEKPLLSPELGPRGYESYFLTTTTLLDVKTELLFALVPWRICHMKRLPFLNVLYPVARPFVATYPFGVYPYLFADAAYLQDYTGVGMDARFLDKMLHTVGLGLYVPYIYDNLLRMECGLNHLGQVTFQINLIHALR
jgi:outer membrane protein assembly factor BamA